MSTKTTIHHHNDDSGRFRLYSECMDDPIDFIYLECDGAAFEAQSSVALSGIGKGSLTIRIAAKWAPHLIVGLQKAMVEAFIPSDIRNMARKVFENDDRARAWLIAKPIVFGGKSAIDLCIEGRADLVLNELGVIEGECWA